MDLRQYPSCAGTYTPRTRLRFMTVGAVRLALHHRGGWLEVLRTGPLPRYAPHLGKDEEGWPHGLWLRDDLLAWAHDNL